MTRIFFILLFLTLVNCATTAQKLSKKLLTKTWYCSCDFKTDTLVLAETNDQHFDWEASFSPSGKVTLHHLKKNISSSVYSYSLKKQSLRFYYDLKDSLVNLNYTINRMEEDGSYKLKTFYALRYKKRKKDDVPPADHFTLVNGEKKKTFYNLTDITVHRMKKGLKHDSIEYISKGEFLELRSDTLLINSYQFSEHNFYKKYPDEGHYFSEFIYDNDSLVKIKIPLKEITKIYSQRDKFNSVINGLAIAALGTFVVSLPVALAVKTDPVNSIFTSSAVYSALSIPVIVSFNIIFSRKMFQVAPTLKNKNTWHFEKLPGAK